MPADFDAGWRAVVELTAERSAFIEGELQAFRSGGDT
jgi:hypothetical protein